MLAPAGEDGIEIHVRSILPDDNSGINLIFSGDDTEIQAVTSTGEFREKKSLTAIDRSLKDFSDLIICMDGTLQYTYVDEKKVRAIVLNHELDPALRARRLIKEALDVGGFDNVTVILIDLEEGDQR